MAGYGVYSGTSGYDYSVGNGGGMGAGQAQTGVDGSANPIQNPSQAQMTPGSYGAATYASLMPQWMQDYFDANVAGEGGESLDRQRSLWSTELPALKARYGEQAALNPYFTQQAGIEKGFDPFNYDVTETNTQSGRFAEYNPQFTYDKVTQMGRDPFSGAVKNSQTQYNQTYAGGPAYSGDGGSWNKAGVGAAVGSAAMGPVGAALGGYGGISGWW